MRRHALLVLLALGLGALAVVPAAYAQEPTIITNIIFPEEGEPFGTFTAVDPLCPSGTFVDEFVGGGGAFRATVSLTMRSLSARRSRVRMAAVRSRSCSTRSSRRPRRRVAKKLAPSRLSVARAITRSFAAAATSASSPSAKTTGAKPSLEHFVWARNARRGRAEERGPPAAHGGVERRTSWASVRE